MSTTAKERLVRELDYLTDSQLETLLRTVDSLKHEVAPALSGAEVVRRFSGILSPEQADAMEAAIEEACERIDAE
jgi:hypothetical protein